MTPRGRRFVTVGVAAVALVAFAVWAKARIDGLDNATRATNPLFRWEFLFERPDTWDEIVEKGTQHLKLTVIPVIAGFVLSSVLALIGRRFRWLLGPIYTVTGSLYTIPSIALFSVLAVYNSDELSAIIALTTYTLLILTRAIVDGLDANSPAALDAADGLGMSATQRLWKVELPLATPVILSGIRVATVTTVGLVGVTAFIRLGGFASWILDGFRRGYSTTLLLGTVLSVLLAVVLDAVLRFVEWGLTPWRRGDNQ